MPALCHCPYDCAPGDARTWAGTETHCPGCNGPVKWCPRETCGWPNRLFSRYCRRCRHEMPDWPAWPTFTGTADLSGHLGPKAPFTRPTDVKSTPVWSQNLGPGRAPAAAVLSAYGALVTFSRRGAGQGELTLADLRNGEILDREAVPDEPVGLAFGGGVLVAVGLKNLVAYSLLGPKPDDVNRPVPAGLKLLWEHRIPAAFDQFVDRPLILGERIVLGMRGPATVGLSAVHLKTREDPWALDPDKTLSGDFAFLLSPGQGRVLLGTGSGVVAGHSLPEDKPWSFRGQYPGGIHGVPRAAVACSGGRLLAFDRRGSLIVMELDHKSAPRPLGQVQEESPSCLGVSDREIVVGSVTGMLTRYNADGMGKIDFVAAPGVAGIPPRFGFPPASFSDGNLVVVNDEGAVHFFGPRELGGAHSVQTFGFPQGGGLAGFLIQADLLVGVSARGEVQALRLET